MAESRDRNFKRRRRAFVNSRNCLIENNVGLISEPRSRAETGRRSRVLQLSEILFVTLDFPE